MKNLKQIIIIFVIAGVLGAFVYLDLGQHLSLEYIKEQQASFSQFYSENTLLAIGAFTAVYIVSTALSLPGAALLTLLGGALFGLLIGTILVSFASTIGATLAFLVSRLLLRDWVQSKFGSYLKSFNDGMQKDGHFYLFTLRLIPAIPFFVINLVMGLTPMKTITFYGVSQLGMLAGTIVFVNAGTQLAQLDSLSGILSPKIIFSFVLLGGFPFIARKLVGFYKGRRIMNKFKKPESFDYNMVVIGGGSAGLVTSYIGAATKGKVALIEKHKMGGDCLNTGCVPSKALIRSAKFMADVKKCQKLGFKSAHVDFNFADVMERVQRVIRTIEPHDSIVESYQCVSHINSIMKDLCCDMWFYISRGILGQKKVAGEIGSSTMPHKINPIQFENAEGNIGISNAMLNYLADKLPISRMQRDLTDSTTLRNQGSALGYSYLALKNILKGLGRITIHKDKMSSELDSHWEIISEAIQTVLRKSGQSQAYEQLKELTRGEKVNRKILADYILQLNIPQKDKDTLLTLTPQTYTGFAPKVFELI